MVVRVINAQREAPVSIARMAKLARRAVRRLRIRTRGALAITFIDSRRMRTLNHRFLRHDRATDVLSFHYAGEPVVGEVLIAPREAQRYARAHGIPYAEELSRYVIHGLLHWVGHLDGTPQEQVVMRRKEDRLLAQCGGRRQSQVSGLRSQV